MTNNLTEAEREEIVRLRERTAYLEAEIAVINKLRALSKGSCASLGEKAAIIKELREVVYQLKYLLKAMKLAKSTYYFELNKVDAVAEKNGELLSEIQTIFHENKGRYGVRRIYQELCRRGYVVNHKRVQRLMLIMEENILYLQT